MIQLCLSAKRKYQVLVMSSMELFSITSRCVIKKLIKTVCFRRIEVNSTPSAADRRYWSRMFSGTSAVSLLRSSFQKMIF